MTQTGPGYDIKLIQCPDYDVELIWRQQGNDIVSLAAICAAAADFPCLVWRRKFNFRWRGPPDSSVSSLILVGWCEEGHPTTKNSLQLSQG